MTFLNDRYNKTLVLPRKEELFETLYYLPVNDIKVIIIGQEPYIGAYDRDGIIMPYANGIPFSTYSQKIPYGLSQLMMDLNYEKKTPDYTLRTFIKKGYLFINKAWSVEYNRSLSHLNDRVQWDIFTLNLIKYIEVCNKKNKVIVTYGNMAKINPTVLNSNTVLVERHHPAAKRYGNTAKFVDYREIDRYVRSNT